MNEREIKEQIEKELKEYHKTINENPDGKDIQDCGFICDYGFIITQLISARIEIERLTIYNKKLEAEQGFYKDDRGNWQNRAD